MSFLLFYYFIVSYIFLLIFAVLSVNVVLRLLKESEIMSMYCSQCGAQLPEGAKFCSECGILLANNVFSAQASMSRITLFIVSKKALLRPSLRGFSWTDKNIALSAMEKRRPLYCRMVSIY